MSKSLIEFFLRPDFKKDEERMKFLRSKDK